MASQAYLFSVDMTCEGCATAVTNVLNKKEGVKDIEIDLKGQKVVVTSSLPSDEILQVIKKTGKACQLIGVKK